MYSGTGTSTGLTGITGNQFYLPNNLYALPPVGGTGNGNSLAFYAGGGVTGAGGSISLRPGDASGAYGAGAIWFNYASATEANDAGYIGDGTTKSYYFTRSMPHTAGNYVELCEIWDNWPGRIEMTIMTYQHAVEGGSIKQYNFSPQSYYFSSGLIQPFAHDGANGWELEKFVNSVTRSRLRIRRTVTVNSSVVIAVYVHIKFIGYNNQAQFYSGTGTSALGNAFFDATLYSPTVVSPGLPVASNGAGRDLTVTAGSSAGTGAGGNLYLRGTNASTTGAGGSIILQPGAQATSGGNGTINFNDTAGAAVAKISTDSNYLTITPQSGKSFRIFNSTNSEVLTISGGVPAANFGMAFGNQAAANVGSIYKSGYAQMLVINPKLQWPNDSPSSASV